MNKLDVTRDAFPLHFALADAYNGTVEPFDVYQGPYVHIPKHGRFWISSDDGETAYIYSEKFDRKSNEFLPGLVAGCIDAMADFPIKKPKPATYFHVLTGLRGCYMPDNACICEALGAIYKTVKTGEKSVYMQRKTEAMAYLSVTQRKKNTKRT